MRFAWVVVTCASCAHVWPGRDQDAGQSRAIFAVNASGPSLASATLHTPSGVAYSYTFTPEHSGVSGDLRAVRFDPDVAYAVGDDGVILTRRPHSDWRAQASGTHVRLNAISELFDRDRFYVVGDGGTILRHVAGSWRAESSPVTADLYAVARTTSIDLAAGAHGTLIAHLPSGWVKADSTVDETLRTLWNCSFNEATATGAPHHEAICAAGDGGRIVRCIIEPLSVSCSVQSTAATEDLTASTAWPFLIGKHGTVLRMTKFDPFTVTREPTRTSVDLFAVAENHWGLFVRDGSMLDDIIAVGADGTVAWLQPAGGPVLTLPDRVELHGIDAQELELFLVGRGGMIIHGVMTGPTMPVTKDI